MLRKCQVSAKVLKNYTNHHHYFLFPGEVSKAIQNAAGQKLIQEFTKAGLCQPQ